MIRIVVLIFSFFLLLSCSEEKRARIRASKADSIMYAAGDMRDYARILALADSLEALGDLTEVNANRWRGVAYFYQGHHRTSEFYYKKAVAADIKSENDALNYNKSARRLANMMLKKGDYEGALRVAMDALDKMRENNSGSETDVAILTNTVGCCLLNLGRASGQELRGSLRVVYEYCEQRHDRPQGSAGIRDSMQHRRRIHEFEAL